MEALIKALESRAELTVERRTGEQVDVRYMGILRDLSTGVRSIVFSVDGEPQTVRLALLRRIARRIA